MGSLDVAAVSLPQADATRERAVRQTASRRTVPPRTCAERPDLKLGAAVAAVKKLPNIILVADDPRPQSLMLTFLGDYLYETERCVFSGSVIDVLGRLGVSEHATRSTLTRMVNRGLLRRQKQGRRMYFGL